MSKNFTSQVGSAENEAKSGLIQIARHRFRAFEAKFKRQPGPQEPLFFIEFETHPVKADIRTTRRQLLEAARASGVRLDPVLKFLGLSLKSSGSRPKDRTAHTAASRSSRPKKSESPRVEAKAFSVGRGFKVSDRLCRRYAITSGEIKVLSQMAFLGRIESIGDLRFILKLVRKAAAQEEPLIKGSRQLVRD